MEEDNTVIPEVGQKLIAEDTACPSLPVKDRIMGFAICYILGFIISILSTFLLLFGAIKKPYKFAIIYTLGNVLSLSSSFFLNGPQKQLKKMFDKTRLVASIVCLFCIVFTFFYAIVIYKDGSGGHKLIMWILVIAQYISMFWYVLSYIPFARTLVKKCCKCIIKVDD